MDYEIISGATLLLGEFLYFGWAKTVFCRLGMDRAPSKKTFHSSLQSAVQFVFEERKDRTLFSRISMESFSDSSANSNRWPV
jgi:hypothetical protein